MTKSSHDKARCYIFLDEVVEVEGEHNVVAKTVTRSCYTELVEEQALSTTDSVKGIDKSEDS